jgi:hypothetical protein
MNEISKYWVMIPVGFKEEHKEAFVENCNKINPTNDDKLLISKWEMLVQRNVLQVVLDVRTGATVCSMVSAQFGTFWQLTNNVIKEITNIKNYTPLTEEEMESPEGMYYNEYQNGIANKASKKTPTYNVDDILDKISESGYPSLSVDEKDFLASLKK